MKKLLAMITILTLFLTACSASRGRTAPAGDSSAQQGAAAGSASGTIVIGANQDIANLDPDIGYDYSTRAIQRNVYDALFKYQGNPAQIVPWLATGYEASTDAKTYTIHLDKRAKFQNGDPVDATAVQYSFNRMLKLNQGVSWMFSGVMDQNSVQVVDPQTVKVTLTKPFSPFISVLPWLWIVNPKEVAAHAANGDDGQAWLKTHSAGSGPFTIGDWQPGTQYTLKADPNYWRGWPAQHASQVIWKIIRESQSQKMALQQGDIQMALQLSPTDYDAVKSDPNIVAEADPVLRGFYIKMNTKSGPTADVHLRRAISYAINYGDMIKADNGYATILQGPVPTGVQFQDPKVQGYTTDLDKAKAELAQSKYPNGGIDLEYVYVTGMEIERQYGLVVLNALKPLGINVKMTPLVWPDIVARAKKPDTQPAMYAAYQTANYADIDNTLFPAYDSSQAGTWSAGTYSNPDVDKLIEQGRATTDSAARQQIYSQLQQLLVSDAPDIFGPVESQLLAYSKKLGGYKFTPIATTAIDFYSLYLTK